MIVVVVVIYIGTEIGRTLEHLSQVLLAIDNVVSNNTMLGGVINVVGVAMKRLNKKTSTIHREGTADSVAKTDRNRRVGSVLLVDDTASVVAMGNVIDRPMVVGGRKENNMENRKKK